jgi:hypothetical protein
MLTPDAALRLGEYTNTVWIAALVLRAVVGVVGSPSRTQAQAAEAAAQFRRIVPGVVLALLGMVAVFLVGYAWTTQPRR